MRRRRFQLPDNRNQSFTLNITSMTDMFTILLVFLLQSYAATSVPIETPNTLALPLSDSEKNPVHAAKLAVSRNELIFEKEKIADLDQQQIRSSDVEATDSDFIKPLFAQLQKLDNKQSENGTLLLQADQSTPYSTLRKVLYTASMAGYPNVKLVTVVGI